MTVRTAEPLPECRLCEAPTRRAVWLENGGLCSECLVDSTVRMLPLRPDLNESTVYVERYRPPVPGQLELPGEQW